MGELSHPSWSIPTARSLPINTSWGVRRIGEVGVQFRTPESSYVKSDVAGAVLVVRERMTDSPSVVLVDPDETFARTVVATLRGKGFECAVASPDEASRELATGRHAVLVVNLDTSTTANLVSQAHENAVAVVVVTNRPSVSDAVAAFRAGVVDYLAKPTRTVELLQAVERAAQKSNALRAVRGVDQLLGACTRWFRDLQTLLAVPGGFSVPPAVRNALTERRDASALEQLLVRCIGAHELAALSRREREVLLALAQGQRGHDLAKCLGISVNTCRTHLKAVLRKLGVRSQRELLGRLGGASRSDG